MRYLKKMYFFVCSFSFQININLAEILAQNVFLKIFKKWPKHQFKRKGGKTFSHLWFQRLRWATLSHVIPRQCRLCPGTPCWARGWEKIREMNCQDGGSRCGEVGAGLRRMNRATCRRIGGRAAVLACCQVRSPSGSPRCTKHCAFLPACSSSVPKKYLII